jgi:hypothetical protein
MKYAQKQFGYEVAVFVGLYGWTKSTISNGLTVAISKITLIFSMDETISCALIL